MKNPTIYVILNKSCNMNAGKAAAQTAHAVSGICSILSNEVKKGIDMSQWVKINPRTVIVLESKNSSEMSKFGEYLKENNIQFYKYRDENSGYEHTAMALEILDKSDERTGLMLSWFELFSYEDNKLQKIRNILDE